MASFHSPLQLPDCHTVSVAHHDSKLLAGADMLSLTIGTSVTIYSAVYNRSKRPMLCQLEVVLELVEAYTQGNNIIGCLT